MRILKIAMLAALAGTMLGSVTMAADLLEPATDAPVADDWSGLYVGAGIEGTYFYNFIPATYGDVSLIVGGNMQADQFVLGVEGTLGAYHGSVGVNGWQVSGEVRAGYLISPEALIYGSLGGLHYDGGANYVQAGGGIEFMVADSMSLDIEAKHWVETNGPYLANSISASLNWHL